MNKSNVNVTVISWGGAQPFPKHHPNWGGHPPQTLSSSTPSGPRSSAPSVPYIIRPSKLKSCFHPCIDITPGNEISLMWIRTFLVEWCKWQSRFSTPWPWPSFSRSILGIFLDLRISHKWREIGQTLLFPPNRKSDICHRMALLWMSYVMTLIYIFKVIIF